MLYIVVKALKYTIHSDSYFLGYTLKEIAHTTQMIINYITVCYLKSCETIFSRLLANIWNKMLHFKQSTYDYSHAHRVKS